MGERIGFISTRFAGADGVSLESAKWAQLLWDYEHSSYWYGGQLDREPKVSYCVPEAFFGYAEIEWINQRLWGKTSRSKLVSRRISELKEYLKETLYDFVDMYTISILIAQNALTIPMHVPLGLALTEFIAETKIPTIAHHHDFHWERTRFSVNAANDYLETAFPPRLDSIQHVVINQAAQEELAWRKGLHSVMMPNVLDFENPPPEIDDYSRDVREQMGLEPDDIMILQPTRIVPRKGIEHSIKMVEMLGDPKYKLVISHESGDEGYEYVAMLKELAKESNVDLRFFADRVGDVRQLDDDGRKKYTLWDIYPHADLITYPSLYEGFGNAFLEAIYFRKPVVVNRYSIFVRDIEPKGFQLPIMDGYVTNKLVDRVRSLLENKTLCQKVTEHNYNIAKRYYSYSVLRRELKTLIMKVTGFNRF